MLVVQLIIGTYYNMGYRYLVLYTSFVTLIWLYIIFNIYIQFNAYFYYKQRCFVRR